jgi:hypothetical protein
VLVPPQPRLRGRGEEPVRRWRVAIK